MKFQLLILCSVLGFASCSSKDTDNDAPSGGACDSGLGVGELKNCQQATIQEFLVTGGYKSWRTSAGVQDATLNSPHGPTKIFFNPTLVSSIESGAENHEVGSIVVKELYNGDKTTIKGYALDAKITAGTGGDTWLFYEGFPPAYNQYRGVGLAACTGCHAPGKDFLRAPLP